MVSGQKKVVAGAVLAGVGVAAAALMVGLLVKAAATGTDASWHYVVGHGMILVSYGYQLWPLSSVALAAGCRCI